MDEQLEEIKSTVSRFFAEGGYNDYVRVSIASDVNNDGNISASEYKGFLENHHRSSQETGENNMQPPPDMTKNVCEAALVHDIDVAHQVLKVMQNSSIMDANIRKSVISASTMNEGERNELIEGMAHIMTNALSGSGLSQENRAFSDAINVHGIDTMFTTYFNNQETQELVNAAPSMDEIGQLSPTEFCTAALGRDIREIEL